MPAHARRLLADDADKTLAQRLELYSAFVKVSDSGATFDASGIPLWLNTKAAEGKSNVAAKALVLMESMGEKVPPSVWQKVKPLSPPPRGTNAYEDMLWNMDKAAYASRQGETILYALAAIGNGGVSKLHPAIMGRIVNALKMVGLKKEASLLAAESLLD